MKTISVLSRKGGCGKTLISHLLCCGLSMLNYPTILMQTDVRSNMPPEDVQGRDYLVYGIDGRMEAPEDKFLDIYKKVSRFAGAVLVIDGGANRRNIDLSAAAVSDMVIIPCGFSSEDLEVARQDMTEIRKELEKLGRGHTPVALLLNRWPGDNRRLEIVMRRPWIEGFLEATHHDRLNFRVPELTSVVDITFHGAPSSSLNVKKAATDLAEEVKKHAGLPEPAREEAA